MAGDNFNAIIQYNCDVSDAHGGRGYSMCTLFLRLRSYFRWEKGLEPWDVPDSSDLLDWIAAKEAYWLTLEGKTYSSFAHGETMYDPFQLQMINEHLVSENMVYGAGYGRSLKPIFFLAEKLDKKMVNGSTTFILGHEVHRELAAPFAMLQADVIYLRKEPFRYYLWDQITDIRPSGKGSLQYALQCYQLLGDNGVVDRDALIGQLANVVDNEMELFIYHEIGELKDTTFDRQILRNIVVAFVESPIELLARAIKDILADTHPEGMMGYIIGKRKESSLGFYVTFLDGLRKMLFPEIQEAFCDFMKNKDWVIVEQATGECRKNNMERAKKLQGFCEKLDSESLPEVRRRIEQELLAPLGLLQKR
jgi:hypothetical protein